MNTDWIAQLLYHQRRRAGLSGAEMARLLGVSRQTIWSWEHGRVDPKFSAVMHWLKVCQDRQR